MDNLSAEDLAKLLKLAKDQNISVNELIKFIQNTNPKFLEKKAELDLRNLGIIIGGFLSIISLLGAIGLAFFASSATVIITLIIATFIFAGGTLALSSMENVSTRDFSAMVKEILTAKKEEEKTPLNIPLKDIKSPEYEPIPDSSQEQDGNK